MDPKKAALWKELQNQADKTILHFNDYDNTPAKIQNSDVKKISACHISLDYTYQQITPEALNTLFELAHASHLPEKIHALFHGEKVNIAENRPALHTALRAAKNHHPILVNQENTIEKVFASQNQMRHIAEQIRAKQWFGYSGKAITDIVNIGIGGSDFGPRFCMHALENYVTKELSFHFISDIDEDRLEKTLTKLNPETTLFIVCSKSFTTTETLYNAQKAMAWVGSQHTHHFIAVTANTEKAQNDGYQHIIPIWDWIGGRFSFCSAINLISAIAIGFEPFEQLLTGARQMDAHFLESNIQNNLPIIFALLGIWNINFLHISNQLMLTYGHQLESLLSFVQQLDMESNGKSTDNQGNPINYSTAPMIWGGPGNQAQHSYYQLLCQGAHRIAIDLFTLNLPTQQKINTTCIKTIQALSTDAPDHNLFSNRLQRKQPMSHISLNHCTPYTIGALVAFFEHKIFVQSVVWDINPFDQPGVQGIKFHSQIEQLKL